MKYYFIIFSIFLINCKPDYCPYCDSCLANVTDYKITINRYTKKGIGIDDPIDSRFILDAKELDWQVDDFESCLDKNFKENPIITEPEGHCLKKEFQNGFYIDRKGINVKVPNNLYQSKCSGEWLFPCNIDQRFCEDKGIEPSETCPCDCRATVQDNRTIITNHILNVFRTELARLVTTCNRPWAVKQIQPCLHNPHL